MIDFGRLHVIPAPVPMTVRVRQTGVYHGGLDWDGPRQEPDRFERVPIVALAYSSWDGVYSSTSPEWAMRGDGVWVKIDHHWYSDLQAFQVAK